MAQLTASNAARKQRPQPSGSGQPPGAVVIGSDYIALGAVRSLGRHGIPVWVLHDGEHFDATLSRYARRCMAWPAEEAAGLALLDELAAQFGRNDWALYPTHDEAVALVARHHRMLSEHFKVTTPSWDMLQWAYDKRRTHELADRLGIAHAWTRYPRDAAEVAALDCAFPAILKPAVKHLTNPFTLARAWRVEDRRQLIERYAEACRLVPPDVIMVQELIPGGGEAQFSFAAICAEGRPLASLVARRTRQYPVEFGRGSTFVETVDDPAIEQLSRRLLAEIGYTGLVELEFKRDPRNGEPKLLDINARTWGWHTLGRRVGIDFPFLAWQLVQGAPLAETRAQPGARWVRALTDVPAALAGLRQGRLSVSAYLRSLRPPFECAMFAPDDPLPGLLDLPSFLWRSAVRKLKG